jgi:hypothetical protein
MKKILFPVLILLFSISSVYSQEAKKKTPKDYIVDLKSDNDETVMTAARELGAAKAKDAIEPMIESIKSHQNPKVRIVLAKGLGLMGTKQQPTSALSEVVKSDDDNSVVYASLLSILNLKDFENPDAISALEFCEQNKSSDPYINDVVKKIRDVMKTSKK